MFVSPFSPVLEERRIIALLLVAGEQFDAFKKSVLGKDSTETIYSAIWLLKTYLKNADYVNQSKWPLVIQIVQDAQNQIERLFDWIGMERVEVYEGLTDEDFAWFNVPTCKYSIEVDGLLTTIVPRAMRRPYCPADASLIKKMVEILSQPMFEDVKICAASHIRSTEEPVLPSRPQMRVARPRRHSMSPLDELCERGLFEKGNFDEMFEDDRILNDIAFKNHEVTEYVFCIKSDATTKERYDCSCALLTCYYAFDEAVHSECRDSAIDNMTAIDGSIVLRREKRSLKREFEFVVNKPRKELFLKQ